MKARRLFDAKSPRDEHSEGIDSQQQPLTSPLGAHRWWHDCDNDIVLRVSSSLECLERFFMFLLMLFLWCPSSSYCCLPCFSSPFSASFQMWYLSAHFVLSSLLMSESKDMRHLWPFLSPSLFTPFLLYYGSYFSLYIFWDEAPCRSQGNQNEEESLGDTAAPFSLYLQINIKRRERERERESSVVKKGTKCHPKWRASWCYMPFISWKLRKWTSFHPLLHQNDNEISCPDFLFEDRFDGRQRERETRESWNKKTASGWSRLCLTWVMLAVTCCPFQWIRYHPLLMMILSCLVSLSLINLHLRARSYFISYWSCIRRRDKEGLKRETKRHLQTNGDNELREFVYNISAYKLHSSSHLVTPFIKDFPFCISHDTTCCSQLVCFFSDNDRK